MSAAVNPCPDCGEIQGDRHGTRQLCDRCWGEVYDGLGPAPGVSNDRLGFRTPSELRAITPAAPQWVWDGYAARGWLTIIAGRPKVGKSTLVCAAMTAVAANASQFLGREVSGGHVVLVTEEAATTALAKLPQLDTIRVLTRDTAFPKPSFMKVVSSAIDVADVLGAKLLVVDSWAFWAELGPDAEKDAGAAQDALWPLLAAATTGLAVILVHHQRKTGGEGGDAVRGSGAIAASADAIVEVERLSEGDPKHRQLVAVSRWPDTPALLVVDHDPGEGSWRVIGQGEERGDAVGLSWDERLLNALPDSDPGASYDDLEELTGAQRKEWYRHLAKLVKRGLIIESGRGVKGDPKRYRRATANSVPEFRSDLGTESEHIAQSDIPYSVPPL